jgi:hypothetical protein
MVLGYPHDHPTLGTYEGTDTSKLYLKSTSMGGMIFPDGTSSVLYFGSQPASVCYGEGTSDSSKAGQAVDGTIYCYDPTSIYKGTHGYPWRGFVWAYDAHDLAAVKAGQKQPWEVLPYATWTLTAPFMTQSSSAIQGVTYDPVTQLIYVSLGFAETNYPVIAVFKLNTGAVIPPVVTPPVVQADTPTATITSAVCTIKSIRAKMPSGGGWDAEFFDGARSLGKDTVGAATRPSQKVDGGQHSLTVRWTKAGHDPIVTPALVLECK